MYKIKNWRVHSDKSVSVQGRMVENDQCTQQKCEETLRESNMTPVTFKRRTFSSAARRRSPEESRERVFERIKVGLVSNFLLNPRATFIREEQSRGLCSPRGRVKPSKNVVNSSGPKKRFHSRRFCRLSQRRKPHIHLMCL